MANETQRDWQKLLWIHNHANPNERRRMADELGVNEMTIRRWEDGSNKPSNMSYVRALATMIPGMEATMTKALKADFPDAFPDLIDDDFLDAEYSPIAGINAIEYARALEDRANMTEESTHYSVVRRSLRRMVISLDRRHDGLVAVLAQCVPPVLPCDKVTKLHLSRGFGTEKWKVRQIEREIFIGNGSLAAAAVKKGDMAFWPLDTLQLYASEYIIDKHLIKSSAAFPIKRNGKVAGAVYIGSTQKDFFTPTRCDAIVQWMFIFAQAFDDRDFYPLSQIEFYTVPSLALQDEVFDFLAQVLRDIMQKEPTLTTEEIEQKARLELRAMLREGVDIVGKDSR